MDTVFHALGLPDAELLAIKSGLVGEILARLKAKGLGQAQAAKAMGMPLREVGHLLQGRIDRFSLERLVSALIALEPDIRFRLVVEAPEAAQGVPQGRP